MQINLVGRRLLTSKEQPFKNDRPHARFIIHLVISSLCFYSCQNSKGDKEPVLLADREAPLGWVYLKMYKDKSFEFISRGLRDKTVYPGTFHLKTDTIFFTYKDSIPKAGKTAIISKKAVTYIDGSYFESVEIKLNNLTK